MDEPRTAAASWGPEKLGVSQAVDLGRQVAPARGPLLATGRTRQRDQEHLRSGVAAISPSEGRGRGRGRSLSRDRTVFGMSLSAVLHGLLLAVAASLDATESRRPDEDAGKVSRSLPLVVELLAREPTAAPKVMGASSEAGGKATTLPTRLRQAGAAARKSRIAAAALAPTGPRAAVVDKPSDQDRASSGAASSTGEAVGAGTGTAGSAVSSGTSCCGQGVAPATSSVPSAVPARPLVSPRPLYPSQARRMGWEGTVGLQVLVDIAGNAAKVTVVAGSGYAVLDESAVDAVRRWRFAPARESGRPVAMVHEMRIRFRLDDPAG